MKIRINKMHLENYKNIVEKDIYFFDKTKISGRNRSGKSTIADSYFDIMTGKLSDGTTPDGTRRHDENGVDIDKVDVVREMELEIDGKPTTIRKITKQKWRKPRGQAEEVFDGNVTEYEIDGFSYNAKKFSEFMEELAKPDVLLMCSNAIPFLTLMKKSTVEARKILEKLSGFDLNNFIKEIGPEYAEVSLITNGHSAEDTLKKLRKQLAAQKKKMEEKNTEIKYEKSRTEVSAQTNTSDLELEKAEWRNKIIALDEEEQKINESVKDYDSLSNEIISMKVRMEEISEAAGTDMKKKRIELKRKIIGQESIRDECYEKLRTAERRLDDAKRKIKHFGEELKKAQDDYSACAKREFDESKIYEIEKEQFDENSIICPTCGQILSTDLQGNLRASFQKSKEKRIEEQKKEKALFESERERVLDAITERGSTANKELKKMAALKRELELEIEEEKNELSSKSEEIESLHSELEKIPKEVDVSDNKEYQKLSKEISKKEADLETLNNRSFDRSELRKQRNESMEEISKIESRIQKINDNKAEQERRILNLDNELREFGQIAADIERQIYIVTDFSMKKNEKLAGLINPYFDSFDFSFIGQTIEGNLFETLEIVRNGTSYFGGLNTSDRILCEISLVRGLQKMNSLNLPIFVDNCETINKDRLPNTEQQLILLEVSDKELEVKEVVKYAC